eukprot:842156-Amphidinium_carterae.1
MVPDYALIGQIVLCTYSFANAQVFKFFKDLAFSGAWCYLDEFNRINIEVLSVIAPQSLVFLGKKADVKSYNDTNMELEGTLITMTP